MVLRFPWIHRTLWFRVARLAHHRGAFEGVLDPGAMWEFLGFVANEADAAGRLRADRMPHLKAKFAAARGWTTTRQAAKYQAALLALGWLRRTQAPAPGYPSRFQLQLPLDVVPNWLPEELMEPLRLWDEDRLPDPDDADVLYGHLTDTEAPPVSLEPSADPFAPQEPVQPPARVVPLFPSGAPDLGPLPAVEPLSDPASVADVMGVHPSPSLREGSSHLWSSTCTTPGATRPNAGEARWRPARRRVPLDESELAAARRVLGRCEPWWTHQRGSGRGCLSAAESEALTAPVAYALRRATPTELVEVMTERTKSARSLPHVVGARLWRLIRSRTEWDQTHPADVQADDAGARHNAMLARRADQQAAVRRGPGFGAFAAARQQLAEDNAVRHAAREPQQPIAAWLQEPATAHAEERAWADLVEHGNPLEVYRALARGEGPQRR